VTAALLAGFPDAERLKGAAVRAKADGRPALDAFTPYPVQGLPLANTRPTNIPWWMLGGGLLMAILFYGLEWLSATRLYPFDQGARPFHSWPAFVVATVEVSVLAAALTGFVAFLLKSGLPRLNHPLFASQAFERASQDQFVLAVPRPEAAEAAGALRQRLWDDGASWVEEAEL
jgi:hypothetical protein